MDLSNWSFVKDGPVCLDGEWEVRWDCLLPPEKMGVNSQTVQEYTEVPSPWSQSKPEVSMFQATGSASMRLVIKNIPNTDRIAFRLSNTNAAWTLWADGRLIGNSGVPGLSAESESPRPSSVVVPLQAENYGRDSSAPLELVLNISNQHFRDGGVFSSLWLGPEPVIQAVALRDSSLAMLLTGILLIMGIYHIVLFLFRRQDRSPLLFGFYSLLWMGNYIFSESSGWIVLAVFPNMYPFLMEHLGIACFIISIPVGFTFFRLLYPHEFSLRVQWYTWIMCGVFTALAVFGSTLTLTALLPLYYISSGILIFYCFGRLFQAWRRGRDGACFIFVGFMVLGLVGINDMLTDLRLIHSVPLLPLGLFVFIMSQALALSQRLFFAFSSVENLSLQLENKNLSLEMEMAERNKLEREIINISEDERRRVSIDLHDGLCQLLAAARLRCSAILHMGNSRDGDLEMEKLSGILDELVDQAYNVTHGLWTQEYTPESAAPSFSDMAQRLSRSSGISIEYNQVHACKICPSSANVIQLYRIAQEALTNAVKHSKATRICLDCSCNVEGIITISVCDNGIGRARAKSSAGGLGVGIMNHRANIIGATLLFEDVAEGGTIVTCSASCGIINKFSLKTDTQ